MNAFKNHSPEPWFLSVVVVITLIAFAANSVLCRLALADAHIDAAAFTLIRLGSGALFLLVLLRFRKRHGEVSSELQSKSESHSWRDFLGAFLLFTYAAAFSWAYLKLDTGTGALILFACVQFTMLTAAYFTGRKFNLIELAGVLLALAGLVYLVLPTASRPSLQGFVFMAIAGVAWGAYTLVGRGVEDATKATAVNFLRAIPLAIVFVLWSWQQLAFDLSGVIYALLSGMVASGAGYVLWFYCLKYLSIPTAATCQLSVPFIAALGGFLFNQEAISLRFLLALTLVVLGIAMVIHADKGRRQEASSVRSK